MPTLAFLDTEVTSKNLIADIGCLTSEGKSYHGSSLIECMKILKGCDFVCGHNVIHHDLKYFKRALPTEGIPQENVIDTLYLSPLLFPNRPYHRLLKDDKLQAEELNNPLNDAQKARDLFYEEVAAFHQLDETLQQIYYTLLKYKQEFYGFFAFLGVQSTFTELEQPIQQAFSEQVCVHAPLGTLIEQFPVELAFALSLIRATDRYSITPPWVLKNYPEVERVLHLLRSKPCLTGCSYCDQHLNIHKGLKEFFGYEQYRSYKGKNLQEQAVKAAIDNKSLLAIFPTGGGKSITFQVPALMSGRNEKGLTVVISPLQSLMKDQVDNLEKNGITDAVTINGLLDPIERAKSFERVEDGSASLLYISPETLRSKTMERLLLGRKIVRFVIDEAHCFSSWGQDFRVDYLYIGDFIKALQEKKELSEGIPVSCFTATAKLKVIEDICTYFHQKLGLVLTVFSTPAKRENLIYTVSEKNGYEEKYTAVRTLIEEKNCPTIIYVAKTKRASKIAEQLRSNGFQARAFHGKMESSEKTANQNAFINGEVPIMVATSAFGMGVDKKDVGLVIHFDISDSLENYVQEAGRAGRDEHVKADCHILFNEEDLSNHFVRINQSKLNIKEIQQIWKAIKDITKFRETVSNSALEIARKAGWDDAIADIETKVKTAIAALEDAGYIKRGQNIPQVYANSILVKNAQEAREKIVASPRFNESQKEKAVRIIQKLISSKNRKKATEEIPEARIDYISDHLGIVKEEVIQLVTLLREENILADAKDLTAFIKRGENKNRSLAILETFGKIEQFLLPYLEETEQVLHLKELNESAEEIGNVTPAKFKTILNFWAIKQWIKRHTTAHSPNHVAVVLNQPKAVLKELVDKRHLLAVFIVDLLFTKSTIESSLNESTDNEVLVEFSVLELKSAYENSSDLFKVEVTIGDVEDALFFLSRIESIKIEGGFMVVYNKMTVERLEKDKRILYKTEDYRKLNQYYENKIEQVHVVGEYALKMIQHHQDALRFVDDYFQLNYGSFLDKHFQGSRQEDLKRAITPAKFKQLIEELSVTQLAIIRDKDSKNSAVIAGPGSGKTRVLVHKLASLLLLEDVKHEQLLMLTFSRAAATEFRLRLKALIGGVTKFIAIKTFHSFCFDLSGKVGNLSKSENIVESTVQRIKAGEVEKSAITKTVLVIDEGQDMTEHEYALVIALMEQNEDMRVILVGDDDQAIYEFRKSSAKYLEQFIHEQQATKIELIHNYRSKQNIVDFANQYAAILPNRLKVVPISAIQQENGIIQLVHYQSRQLVMPLVNAILKTELSGSTVVLTYTNEEAFLVASLLKQQGKLVKLIQSNEGFSVFDILEVRRLVELVHSDERDTTISEELWNTTKQQLKAEFGTTTKYEIVVGVMRVFEKLYPKTKYKTDLTTLIRESALENFYYLSKETIVVSTMHKAKGKEFDNVFLLLDNFQRELEQDDKKRLLYVALTRAKKNQFIHTNGNFLDHIQVAELERSEDTTAYQSPTELILNLNHSDLHLDTFLHLDAIIGNYKSGDALDVGNQRILHEGNVLFRYSDKFKKRLQELNDKGYYLTHARVNFSVYWQKQPTINEDNVVEYKEVRIILPEVRVGKIN